MWYMHEGLGWWTAFGGLWMVIFWVGLIALVVWAVNKLSGRGSSETKHNPMDIAKERYACGEILKEDFERIKKDLS